MAVASINLDRFNTFIEINTLINSDFSDLNAVLKRIVESATKLTAGEAASLLLLDPKEEMLTFTISIGETAPKLSTYKLAVGEGIAGWVAKNNRSLLVPDTSTDDRHQWKIDEKTGFQTKSVLAAPLRVKSDCIGVIEILNKSNGSEFTTDDLVWLEIFANQAGIAVQNARNFQQVKNQMQRLQDKVTGTTGFHTFIYKSKAMKEQMNLVKRVASTNSTILILGESGVGKELIAEQIHLSSPRKNKPFIRVNCAALPASLLESELFGHVKGAFTDAVADRKGRFSLADQGTIFLDEIGDFPISLQAKILRVLQEKIFEPVGSSKSVIAMFVLLQRQTVI